MLLVQFRAGDIQEHIWICIYQSPDDEESSNLNFSLTNIVNVTGENMLHPVV